MDELAAARAFQLQLAERIFAAHEVLAHKAEKQMDRYVMDPDGNIREEPDLIKWGRWFENINNRRIAEDTIGDVRISTVFLGIDHSFSGGNPVLFETMVFNGEHDEWMDRYCTRDEALAGHRRVVDAIKSGRPIDEE